jgi:hypothetical protein
MNCAEALAAKEGAVPGAKVNAETAEAPVRVSTVRYELVPSVICNAEAVFDFNAKVEAAFAVRLRAPAEDKAKVPDVAVEIVRSPEVFAQEEVEPEATTKAPVELPMFVAAVPVALILVVPVTVKPPVP